MVNPIVIIILAAYVLSFLVLRIAVKPRKPVFTGAMLLMLILLISMTTIIDVAIYSAETLNGFEEWLVSFATSVDTYDTAELEGAFRIFAWLDIVLFVLTAISMYVELRAILISVYSEKGKLKAEKADSDSSEQPAKES